MGICSAAAAPLQRPMILRQEAFMFDKNLALQNTAGLGTKDLKKAKAELERRLEDADEDGFSLVALPAPIPSLWLGGGSPRLHMPDPLATALLLDDFLSCATTFSPQARRAHSPATKRTLLLGGRLLNQLRHLCLPASTRSSDGLRAVLFFARPLHQEEP